MSKAAQIDGFINQVSEDEIVSALIAMEADSSYVTKPTYRGNVEKWPNNQMSFIAFHLEYLRVHPSLDPHHYIANLRLSLRKKA